MAERRFAQMSSSALENEQALRQGIRNQEIYLDYQPKIDAVSGHLLGFEALARWLRPCVGPVSPTKSLTGVKGSGKAGDGSQYTKAGSAREHAERWAAAVGNDIEALGHLYAPYFTSEWNMVDDHLEACVARLA